MANDGDASDRGLLGYSSATATRFLVTTATLTQADSTVTVASTSAPVVLRMAGAWAANDVILATGGSLGTQDTSVTVPTLTQVCFGNEATPTAASCLNGHLRSFAYYPTRLPNATLQALTS